MTGSLSPRERQVLDLAAKGMIDKQVCAELGISLGTVRVYWKRLRAKYDDRSRYAILAAYGRGEMPGVVPAAKDETVEILRRLTLAVFQTQATKRSASAIDSLDEIASEAADHLTRLGVSLDPAEGGQA